MAALWPILYALFAWWFSTGLIMFLDGLPRRSFVWSFIGSSVVAVVALYGLAASRDTLSVAGTYQAFTWALLAWAWIEMSFYLGYVTGLKIEPCPEGCAGWKHLGHAIKASLWHELAILAFAVAVFAITWNGANHVGLWTFVVMWWMHQSAKLNVLLGVPNLNEQFLPAHLGFLRSFLNQKPMNLLFPVSVTVSTVIAVFLIRAALDPSAGPFETTGFIFLSTLMVVAILEHWFLVLPIPVAALWNWSLASRRPGAPFDVEIVVGFLGVGKTSYIRRLLDTTTPRDRTLLLVNDFGTLGIDGALLTGRGADVVELNNGCICCSLAGDIADQLEKAVLRWAPTRVLIEPSGVADVASLLVRLDEPRLQPILRSRSVTAVIDASRFLNDYGRMVDLLAAQVGLAKTLILNKIDLAPSAELGIVRATLRELNPTAKILLARHGLVEVPGSCSDDPIEVEVRVGTGRPESLDVTALRSWSAKLSEVTSPAALQGLLEAVVKGAYGPIERVKGIARSGSGWVHFDVAGGRSTVAAFAPRRDEQPRVMAIGQGLDDVGLQAAFEACAGDVR
jgi:putative photosynthetic complex assembly protein 2